jgi:uncharacterized membrane protein
MLVGFLLLPGEIASKTHIALHGLCAQRPSHSLLMGGSTLPLDARMTGIYIGAASTLVWLAAAGRLRRSRTPPRLVLAVLTLFVVALGADGFNSTLADLGGPHLYPPGNGPRLVTGILGGTSLGVGTGYLLAVSVWPRAQNQRAPVSRWWELAPPLGISGALGLLAWTGLPILYAPYAVGLLAAAMLVFAAMMAALIGNLWRRDWAQGSPREFAMLAVFSVFAATGVIGGLAGVRFVLERTLGLAQLT